MGYAATRASVELKKSFSKHLGPLQLKAVASGFALLAAHAFDDQRKRAIARCGGDAHVDEARLKRRLQEDGSNFQSLLDQVRYRDSLRLLANASLAIKQVAEAINSPGGLNAVNLKVAEQYVAAFANLAKTNNTLIVPSNLSDLAGLVATTDFAAIKSRPFTGQCPTAYDGQEYVFEFATGQIVLIERENGLLALI